MRRLAGIAAGLVVLAAAALAVSAATIEKGTTYDIVFDNASGLVEQADFRVGGVAVGAIESFAVAPGARARVTVSVSDTGFGGLRSDARCQILQQSLIGEYFVECQPGTRGKVLADGATIPVEQTESPIAADLVNNIMRRPFRERFSILLSELGAGFAARGDDVNDTIRRALPALQETNRVLKILGDNRRTLRRLAADSGQVLKVLGERRRDVGRFVTESRDLAVTTAQRREALRETFRRFPGFLREFTPTMRELGRASSELAPTMADLRAAAPSVERLLATLPPFARASEPAVQSLGQAGVAGREMARVAGSTVRALGTLGGLSVEPANNLAIILSHLDDRDFAVEPDPDSPTGRGYTGLEAILQYPFDQSLAINIFDTRGYLLKLDALINECSAYTDAEDAKAEPERTRRCSQALGPNQPGITTPDPTAGPSEPDQEDQPPDRRRKRNAGAPDGRGPAGDPKPSGDGGKPGALDVPGLSDLLKNLPDVLGGNTPDALGGRTPDALGGRRPAAPDPGERPGTDLLDFLLAP